MLDLVSNSDVDTQVECIGGGGRYRIEILRNEQTELVEIKQKVLTRHGRTGY
jgi:hypothetical protein